MRAAGRTPGRSGGGLSHRVRARALSCVTDGVMRLSAGGYRPAARAHQAVLADGRAVALSGAPGRPEGAPALRDPGGQGSGLARGSWPATRRAPVRRGRAPGLALEPTGAGGRSAPSRGRRGPSARFTAPRRPPSASGAGPPRGGADMLALAIAELVCARALRTGARPAKRRGHLAGAHGAGSPPRRGTSMGLVPYFLGYGTSTPWPPGASGHPC